LHSDDGGDNWHVQRGGLKYLSGIEAADADTLWASGNLGGMYRTTDGGANWYEQPTGTHSILYDVKASDTANAITFGNRSAAGISLGPNVAVTPILLVGDQGSNGTILHTTDGGDRLNISYISPGSGEQETEVQITDLAGCGFQPGAEVRIEQGITTTVIDAMDENVVQPYKITCRFSLVGAPTGSYDVVVRNPDGQETKKAGGFTVNAPPCGEGSGAAVMVFGLMMGLLSIAGSGSLRRRRKKGD
jgi:hypothetical protein